MAKKVPNCPYCGVPMLHLGDEKIQLGQTGWILGDLPNLLAGSLPVRILYCPACGKVDFFLREEDADTDEQLPQRTCPSCGLRHDFDYPKCPNCNYDYYAKR